MTTTVNIAVGPPPQIAHLEKVDDQIQWTPNPQFFQWINLMWKWSTNFGNNANASIGGFQIGGDYIRDVANSFGLASTVTGGDDVRFWAGTTYANRDAAPARIYETGAAYFSNISVTGGNIATTGYVQASGTTTITGTISGAVVSAATYGQSNTGTASQWNAAVVGYNGYTGGTGNGSIGIAGVLSASNAQAASSGVFGYAPLGAGVAGVASGSGGKGVYGSASDAGGYGVVAESTGGGVALDIRTGFVKGTIAPSASNTYDLGSNTKLYANSWAFYHNSGAATVYDSTFLISTGYAGMSAHATHNMAAGDYKAGSVPGASTAPYLYFHVGGKIVGFINGIGGYATA